ncbi:hypothetical protein BFL35_16190 [Clavibacter michiganensis]|nr:hypothetical protein BFL35_16190 [Clavibacter michiganensis]
MPAGVAGAALSHAVPPPSRITGIANAISRLSARAAK